VGEGEPGPGEMTLPLGDDALPPRTILRSDRPERQSFFLTFKTFGCFGVTVERSHTKDSLHALCRLANRPVPPSNS